MTMTNAQAALIAAAAHNAGGFSADVRDDADWMLRWLEERTPEEPFTNTAREMKVDNA